MASLETSVIISAFIGLILIFTNFFIFPTILIGVLPVLVFTGFIASAMASRENYSYRAGGIAGGVLAILFFLVGFFTGPELSYNFYGLGIDFTLMAQGFVYLLLGFVVSLAIFMLLGAFGGLISQELLSSKEDEPEDEDNSQTSRY